MYNKTSDNKYDEIKKIIPIVIVNMSNANTKGSVPRWDVQLACMNLKSENN